MLVKNLVDEDVLFREAVIDCYVKWLGKETDANTSVMFQIVTRGI